MTLDTHTALALLNWQIELGADEALLDAPVDRFELPEAALKRAPRAEAAPAEPPSGQAEPEVDAIAEARTAAAGASDLEASCARRWPGIRIAS